MSTPSSKVIAPSAEQLRVINCNLDPGSLILVNAFAGTGKTTTLTQLANARDKRGLYLCYNAALKGEAMTRFPAHVKCQTTHGLAYAKFGSIYKNKLGNLRLRDLMVAMREDNLFVAKSAVDTVTAFTASLDKEIGPKHIPTSLPRHWHPKTLDMAKTLWKRMQDVGDASVPMSHDGYLKLWSLSEPVVKNCDYVALDEAQDSNPLVMDFAFRQLKEKAAAVIMVGDRYQGIYGWRGAVNAMSKGEERATERLALTESWRFGSTSAAWATNLLQKALGCPHAIIGRGGVPRHPRNKNHAILSRSNAALILRAGELARSGQKIFWAGTNERSGYNPAEPYGFNVMRDLCSIKYGDILPREASTVSLRAFTSYGEILSHASEGEGGGAADPELAAYCKLVENEPALKGTLERLERSCSGPETATISMSSGHRSKGLEWDSVEVMENFIPIHNPPALQKLKDGGMTKEQFTEEVHLLYVALTRSRTAPMTTLEMRTYLSQGKNAPRPTMDAPDAPQQTGQRMEQAHPPQRTSPRL